MALLLVFANVTIYKTGMFILKFGMSICLAISVLGRGPEGFTMPPPPHTHTSLQNYVFLNPQSVHNKKEDVNSAAYVLNDLNLVSNER